MRRRIYKKIYKKMFCFFLVIFLINVYYYRKGINSEQNNSVYFKKIDDLIDYLRILYYTIDEKLSNPFASKLIPDQLIIPGQLLRKTLVLNFENTIVNYNYHLGSGVDCLGRPYLNKFLDELSPFYEIIVFSNSFESSFVEGIVKGIDITGNKISYVLAREASARYLGQNIKDLNYLNRDLKNVLVIDFKEERVPKHKNNLIILPKFTGEELDSEMKNIIPFLKEMSKKEVADVRQEIEKYGNYKPYINYYKSNPKYRSLLPNEKK